MSHVILVHSFSPTMMKEEIPISFKKVSAHQVARDLIALPQTTGSMFVSISNKETADLATQSLIKVAPVLSGLNLFAKQPFVLTGQDRCYIAKVHAKEGSDGKYVEWYHADTGNNLVEAPIPSKPPFVPYQMKKTMDQPARPSVVPYQMKIPMDPPKVKKGGGFGKIVAFGLPTLMLGSYFMQGISISPFFAGLSIIGIMAFGLGVAIKKAKSSIYTKATQYAQQQYSNQGYGYNQSPVNVHIHK